MGIGFRSYIIADPALLVYLKNRGFPVRSISAERQGSEQRNAEDVPALSSEEIDLSSEKHVPGYAVCYCISERSGKQAGIRPEAGMEFEAFVLNEMCQFTEHSVILFTVMRWDIFAGCPIGLELYGMVMLFRKK